MAHAFEPPPYVTMKRALSVRTAFGQLKGDGWCLWSVSGDMGAVTFGVIIEMTAAVLREVGIYRPSCDAASRLVDAACSFRAGASSVMGTFPERRTQPDRANRAFRRVASRHKELRRVIVVFFIISAARCFSA